MEQIERHPREVREELIEVRRDIHRHPEVSGQEERTARVVAARLRAPGLEVRMGVGGYGVVGALAGAKLGPTVAYRADMDAVTRVPRILCLLRRRRRESVTSPDATSTRQ